MATCRHLLLVLFACSLTVCAVRPADPALPLVAPDDSNVASASVNKNISGSDNSSDFFIKDLLKSFGLSSSEPRHDNSSNSSDSGDPVEVGNGDMIGARKAVSEIKTQISKGHDETIGDIKTLGDDELVNDWQWCVDFAHYMAYLTAVGTGITCFAIFCINVIECFIGPRKSDEQLTFRGLQKEVPVASHFEVWEQNTTYRYIRFIDVLILTVCSSALVVLGVYVAVVGERSRLGSGPNVDWRWMLHSPHVLMYRVHYAWLLGPLIPAFGLVVSLLFYSSFDLGISLFCFILYGFVPFAMITGGGVLLADLGCIYCCMFGLVVVITLKLAFRSVSAANYWWSVRILFTLALGCLCWIFLGMVFLKATNQLLQGVIVSALIPFCESVMYSVLSTAYLNSVYLIRCENKKGNTNSFVHGDQKLMLSLVINVLVGCSAGLRFVLVLLQKMMHPESTAFVQAVIVALIFNVLMRLYLPQWFIAKYTEGTSNDWYLSLQRKALPKSFAHIVNDAKYWMAYVKYSAVLSLLVCRQLLAAQDAAVIEPLRPALIISLVFFVENVIEDLIVAIAETIWTPTFMDWTSISFYNELVEEEKQGVSGDHSPSHPMQFLNVKREPLPWWASLSIISSVVTGTFAILLMGYGQRFIFAVTDEPDVLDETEVHWPLSSEISRSRVRDFFSNFGIST